MDKRVALVTGANRGIGFAIVRALCKKFDGVVYLTARDVEKGKQAVMDLEKEGLHPKFHQLDVTSQESIDEMKKYLQDTYGGLDVLVDNVGIMYLVCTTVPFIQQAEETMTINFYGRYNVYQTLSPIIKPHGRIVEVAGKSGMKMMELMPAELASKFRSPTITGPELVSLMELYLRDVRAEQHIEQGWPDETYRSYSITKTGIVVLTGIGGRDFQNDPREDILINCCCPGYTNTALTDFKGTKTPDEAAELPVCLALLPPNDTRFQGNFVDDGETILHWS
ncbi:carbonyl reductase [NADPH] 1-like [Glandiceps talaboti]